MTDMHSDLQAVIDVAQEATDVQQLAPGIFYDGRTHEVVDIRERLRAGEEQPPARKTGSFSVTDAESFIAYLAKHGEDATELWANPDAGTIRAVVDAHSGAGAAAGHQGHTVTLRLAKTPDWLEWMRNDGEYLTQEDFAEFIEDHLPNFLTPSAADMLELAQTFQATTRAEFASSNRLRSGETSLSWQEQHETRAGKKGDLTIPDTFTIGVQPFEGGPAYPLEARLRYRITDKSLRMAYRLARPRDVLLEAFEAVATDVATQTERQVWGTSS